MSDAGFQITYERRKRFHRLAETVKQNDETAGAHNAHMLARTRTYAHMHARSARECAGCVIGIVRRRGLFDSGGTRDLRLARVKAVGYVIGIVG